MFLAKGKEKNWKVFYFLLTLAASRLVWLLLDFAQHKSYESMSSCIK